GLHRGNEHNAARRLQSRGRVGMEPTPLPRLVDQGLLTLIRRLYEAGTEPRNWDAALTQVRERFNAAAGFLASDALRERRGSIAHATGIGGAYAQSYQARHGAHDVAFARESALPGPGVVWRDSDVVEAEALKDSPFFREWLAPQGLHYIARAVLKRDGA